MLLSRLPAALLLVLGCMVCALVAQTFQYSRGWTNGRKRALLQPPTPLQLQAQAAARARDIDCQLQRLRAMFDGRTDLEPPCTLSCLHHSCAPQQSNAQQL
ncbi:pro-corazonin-like [Nilaparvata lugens]|uniref:Pro-corazonin n=1 Tax=Nilaparvata lugens TaxID=108931 RepID=U3U8Z1_NILLU|nr:pro-corazonin-like [Nilaparvata lugens]BAO00944.1 corazonin [Nilaparvata lugens]